MNILIKNGTIITSEKEFKADIYISEGKIKEIGSVIESNDFTDKIIDAKGKHVYPGLILANSNLGLVEVNSIRATDDETEIGEYNPSVRSIVAYNTDSKVINTLKTNGARLHGYGTIKNRFNTQLVRSSDHFLCCEINRRLFRNGQLGGFVYLCGLYYLFF